MPSRDCLLLALPQEPIKKRSLLWFWITLCDQIKWWVEELLWKQMMHHVDKVPLYPLSPICHCEACSVLLSAWLLLSIRFCRADHPADSVTVPACLCWYACTCLWVRASTSAFVRARLFICGCSVGGQKSDIKTCTSCQSQTHNMTRANIIYPLQVEVASSVACCYESDG